MTNGEPLDVVCVGEALVDFLPEAPGKPVHEVERWTRCSGGSLANVAVGLSRLGAKSALVSVVGQDEFGTFLHESLAREGVDVSHVRRTADGKTGLVFISLQENGERSFAFYRTRSAEQLLGEADVDEAFLERAAVVHCGTNSLVLPEAQGAMLRTVALARAHGRIVSCDPNLRLHFWPDPGVLQGVLQRLVPACSVVKLSEEELEFVTGCSEPEEALGRLAKGGVVLPIATLGSRGALLLFQGRWVRVAAPEVQAVDATGAGDGFMAGFLFGLSRLYRTEAALRAADPERVRELAEFGCAVGARVVTRLGAVAALPSLEELSGELPRSLRSAMGS